MKIFKIIFITILSLVSLPTPAAVLNTYAAWADTNFSNRGHIYVYSGAFGANVQLFNTNTPNTSINTSVAGPLAVAAYEPVIAYGPIIMSSPQQYFKLQTNKPVVWEIEEDLVGAGDDSHDMLAAADTGRYRGTVYMTYLRGRNTDPNYGDAIAIFNPSATTITVEVLPWTGAIPGGSWAAAVANSPVITGGGVWMWSPNEDAAKRNGGTTKANENHYRFNVSGGEAFLWKGNSYNFYSGGLCPPNCGGPERDNLMHVGVDVNTGKKLGTDLFGMASQMLDSPHISITNVDSIAADFEIYHFQPTLPPAAFPTDLWPVDGDDPNGTWVLVDSATNLAPGRSWYFDNRLETAPTTLGIAGFFRIKSTNNAKLTTVFGASIVSEVWCDGDYFYAADTERAFGRRFLFGGKTSQPAAGRNLEVHVIALSAGTSVTLTMRRNSDGVILYTTTQTTTQNQSGLRLNIPTNPIGDNMYYTTEINSTGLIYAYVMSGTEGPGQGGETFFSVPPPVDPFFTVTKSVNKTVAQLGDTLTYILKGENPGFGAVNNTAIWDTLPNNVSLVSAQPPPNISSPPFYAWTNLGTLNSNEQINVTLTVSVDSGNHLDVVTNQATGHSDITTDYLSNAASFTILAPGPELSKSSSVSSAAVGDTIPYTLTYTDTRPPLPSPISGLNLRIRDNGTHDVAQMRYYFEITNNSGSSIDVGDLMICTWYKDNALPAAYNFATDWGGDTVPWDGWNDGSWNGPATGASTFGPASLPPDRQYNVQLCWDRAGSQLLSNGAAYTNINLRIFLNSPEQFDNHFDDYTQAIGSASYVDDHHFALYYQGQLVMEETAPTVADAQSGCVPFYLQVSDTLDGRLNYLSSNPTGIWNGSKISWEDDCIQPAQIKNYDVVVTVNSSAVPGDIIANHGDYQISTGPGISLPINVTVSGTLPTATPTATASPSPSASVTTTLSPSPNGTNTLSPTPSASPTATRTATPLPSATATPAALVLHPNPPSPHPGTGDGIWISYFLSTDAEVTIEIYTVAGEKVKSFDPIFKSAGNNEQFWNARNDFSTAVATGIYPYRITALSPRGEKQSAIEKLAIVR